MKKFLIDVWDYPERYIVEAKNKDDAFDKAVERFEDKIGLHIEILEEIPPDDNLYNNVEKI